MDSISVNTISGDPTLLAGNSGLIEATVLSTHNDNGREVYMDHDGNNLFLKEKCHGRVSSSLAALKSTLTHTLAVWQ